MTLTSDAAPVTAPERLEVVDVIRGFALYGVLLVNFAYMPSAAATGAGHVTQQVLELFVAGSFYPLFVMLFGFGFALQFDRWDARRAPALRLYLRRVLGLFMFGLGIWCLLVTWWTLMQYAVAALVLIPFRRASARTLVVSGTIVILLGPTVFHEVRSFLGTPPRSAQTEANQRAVNQLQREGSYPDLVAARTRVIVPYLTTPWWYFGPALSPVALMLFGAAFARGRRTPSGHQTPHTARVRRLLWWGLPIGIVTNVIMLWRSEMDIEGTGLTGRLVDAGLDFGDTMLALAYAAAVIILFTTSDRWKRILGPLAWVGRTALSNIVLQWLVITTLLFGYGFGLLDRIAILTCVLMSIPIFAAELWLSRWWLARHPFGPLEWLWRTMTYGRPPRQL